jgi:hypothetical protein
VSRLTDAKKARRNKRRAARDAGWVPDTVMDDLVDHVELATDLEAFDARITQRGWTFDEDESDEDFVFWLYAPSGTDVDEDDLAPVTTIWMSAAEDAEIVHLMLAGTSESSEFSPEEFFERVDVFEAHRAGDPPPDL